MHLLCYGFSFSLPACYNPNPVSISESTPEGALLLFSKIDRCSISSLQQNKFSAFSNVVFFIHKDLMKINPVFLIVGGFIHVVHQILELDIGYMNWKF